MNASPEYRRLCACGRTVMMNADICGPCFAAALPSLRYSSHHSPPRRGICAHCGKDRQLDGRDLCESACAKLGLDCPVVRGRGRKVVGP